MSQVSSIGPVATAHLRVPWDSMRRDPHYALAVVRAAADALHIVVDVAFGADELHIYGIDAVTLREGLSSVIASGERRQAGVADQANFPDDGSIELPPELWARWNEAELAIDYAATIRAALSHKGENHHG